jgi:hypothetical protein
MLPGKGPSDVLESPDDSGELAGIAAAVRMGLLHHPTKRALDLLVRGVL